MEKIDYDIQAAKILLDLKYIPEELCNTEYGLVRARNYPWTNEYISINYDLGNKNAAVITSSGDHIIVASLMKCKNIDAIDKNILAKYFAALKIAMIKTYDQKEFKKQFKYIKLYRHVFPNQKLPIIKRIDLKELKDYLTEEEYYFWDSLVKKGRINFSKLCIFNGLSDINKPKYFDDEKEYNVVKKALLDSNIKYYDINLSEEDLKLPNNYDYIHLSNVLEHLEYDYYRHILIKNLFKYLNDGGSIITFSITNTSNEFLNKIGAEKSDANRVLTKNINKKDLF